MATSTANPEDNAMNDHDHENGSGEIDASEGPNKFLIVRPERGGMAELWRYMAYADLKSGMKFLETSGEEGLMVLGQKDDHRWVIIVSIVFRKILHFFSKPMEYTGYLVDFFLNSLSENGGLSGLLCNFLQGKVVIPERGTETFTSTIGHLDGRIDLHKAENLLEQLNDSVSVEEKFKAEMGHRALMDLCIMASKLAYENAKVVQNVVAHHWKMHFVEFYDCCNDFQKENSTQVFIICDKPRDADLIVISFRGTEPFDADDWSTDFDYSWYEIPELGKVHMGFLEALGLGNRENAVTFHRNLQTHNSMNPNHSNGNDSEGTESVSSNPDSDKQNNVWDESSDSEDTNVPPDMVKKSAYYVVRRKLRSLLREHKNAEFVVTGHSLGGALAILFPTVLVLHQEIELLQKLLGVYTFGQPRIGDMQLGKSMESHLQYPFPKYFRIVYCNDLVPRLPCDDKTFLYKHFGVCLYYDSFYREQDLDEEPDKNFFTLRNAIPVRLNAMWEFIRSLIMGYVYGPEYREGWLSILFRIMGLALPGIADHCPTDYVNSVRLGRKLSSA